MKVTVCFDNVRVVVPCGDGTLLVRDLMHEATLRYRKATGRIEPGPIITRLSSLSSGGLLDPDDTLNAVADDNEQILAHFSHQDGSNNNNNNNNNNYLQHQHIADDGASSLGTNSPDYYHQNDQHFIDIHSKLNTNIKRESVKRLSMHVLSTREQNLPTYSALSLPRESRRRESFDNNKKSTTVFNYYKKINNDNNIGNIQDIIIKNDPGPHGLNVVQCIDLSGNDQGLKVEGIEPNGRIAKDGQIDLHDKIIKINGHNLLGIPFTKVQDILRLLMTEPCLKISIVKNQQQQQQHHKYKKKNDSSSSINNKPTILNEDKNVEQHDDSIKKLQHSSNYNLLQNANTRKIGRMIEIDLIKGQNGLGFSVTTRDNPAGGHCPIYIKNIISKGAAVEDGRLRPGDRLLEVNNIEMTGKTQSEVVSFLRSIPVGNKVTIVVSRQEEVTSSSSISASADIPETSPDIPIIIPETSPKKLLDSPSKDGSGGNRIIKKDNNNDDVLLSPRKNRILLTLDIPVHDSEKAGLGVSVKGKQSTVDETTNMDLGIFIKSVLHGGAASRDGRLRTNDQLLNVNGVSLLGLSNSDAMETLRSAMLNTNSPISGIITLTVARKVSSYDDTIELQKNDDKLKYYETKNSIFIPDNGKINDNEEQELDEEEEEEEDEEEEEGGRGGKGNNNRDKKLNENKYKNPDVLDGGLLLSAGASPWNPVIDRLTEQYGKNSLRNESYCLATNTTWLDSISSTKKKFTLGLDQDLLLEESSGNDNTKNKSDSSNKKLIDSNDNKFFSGEKTTTTTTTAYDSQLSLEEFNSSNNKFSRDAVGRQSMSEKRHAALDAKNTDTYKRNKKLREGRNKDSISIGGCSGDGNDYDNNDDKKNTNDSYGTKSNDNTTSSLSSSSLTSKKESSFEAARKKFEKNLNLNTDSNYCGKNDYGYTTIDNNCSSNNNKILPPRKHWLVDDEHVHDTGTAVDHRNYQQHHHHHQFKDNNGEGFSNSRGDVKQASLNSALDDRYKRTKKKGGIRSMLRLGKNRKSLNFGDNIEARHETSNYCSGTINYIA